MKLIEPNDVIIPKNTMAKLRVLDSEKMKSKNGDPMLKNTFEIVEADPVKQDGQSININGLKITKFSVATEKSLFYFNLERAAFGLLPLEAGELDTIDPLQYKGKIGYAIIQGEKVPKINGATNQTLLNPYTQAQLFDVSREVKQYIPKSS